MSRHDPDIALKQILMHVHELVDIMSGRIRDDLDNNRILHLAVIRLLEIMGEAANRIPEDIQVKYPDVPWSQMIGLRNRLIHGYDEIDTDVIWAIIRQDLPGLIR